MRWSGQKRDGKRLHEHETSEPVEVALTVVDSASNVELQVYNAHTQNHVRCCIRRLIAENQGAALTLCQHKTGNRDTSHPLSNWFPAVFHPL